MKEKISSKQLLFEMMQKVNKGFKINEITYDDGTTESGLLNKFVKSSLNNYNALLSKHPKVFQSNIELAKFLKPFLNNKKDYGTFYFLVKESPNSELKQKIGQDTDFFPIYKITKAQGKNNYYTINDFRLITNVDDNDNEYVIYSSGSLSSNIVDDITNEILREK